MAGNRRHLTRKELLSEDNLRTHELELKNGIILLRELTAEEWMALSKEEAEMAAKAKEAEKKGEAGVTDNLAGHFDRVARLVAKTAVDENNKRIFSDEEAAEIKKRMGSTTLTEAYRILARLGQEGPALGG